MTAMLLKFSQINLKMMDIQKNKEINILFKITLRALFAWRGSNDEYLHNVRNYFPYRIYTRLHLVAKTFDFNVVASLMVLARDSSTSIIATR